MIKKLVLVCASMFLAIGSMLAVPAGPYYDSRGNLKVLVSDNGELIYILDRDGNVRHELIVTSENADGSFSTKDTKTGISHPATKNAWFQSNGKVCLNLEWLPSTVTRG